MDAFYVTCNDCYSSTKELKYNVFNDQEQLMNTSLCMIISTDIVIIPV